MLTGLRYSARKFLRAPALSAALLLTIALGIGSNVSVHRFVVGLTRPASPLTSIDRLVSIFGQDEAGPLSYPDYLSLQSQSDQFEWLAAARISPAPVKLASQSAILSVAAITPRFAALLNLPLDQGIVISQSIWQTEFRAKPDIHGEHIRIDGADFRIGSVAPDWLEGVYRGRPVDLWIPLPEVVDSSRRNLWVLGRLRPGATPASDMRVVPYTGMTPEMADNLSRVGTLLNFGAALVFLIASINVASFLLGRASTRSHETSVRVALGATRAQLTRGLLADSIVISLAGGALGVLLAMWTSRVLPVLLFEQDAGHLVAAPDPFSILAAAAACVGITIVCGLLPVVAISHDRPAIVLRRESAGQSPAIRRLRGTLVVAQMTSCCVLVIATAFLFESFHAALHTSVSRRLGNPILASVEVNPYAGIQYFREVQRVAQSVVGPATMIWAGQLPGSLPTWRFFHVEPQHLPLREVTLDIAGFTKHSLPLFALPPIAGRFFGVDDQTCRAAVANQEAARALFGANTIGRSIQESDGLAVEIIGVLALRDRTPAIYLYYPHLAGSPPRISRSRFRAPIASQLDGAELDANVVSPNYFAVMGMPLVAGRLFEDNPGCRIGVINEEAADLYFNGKAVGASVIDETGRRTRIIGVVHATPLGSFEPRVEPAIYFPMEQDFLNLRRMTLILGTREANPQILAELHRRMEGSQTKTLETHLSQTALAPLRIATLIIAASAATAFLPSVLGLFGALSDAARQRQRELAIRIALGAQRRHLIFQVLKEGGRLAGAGGVAGTLASLLLSRILTGIAPPPLWVWLAAPLVLSAAVAIASILPARSALLLNPLTIMRDDN